MKERLKASNEKMLWKDVEFSCLCMYVYVCVCLLAYLCAYMYVRVCVYLFVCFCVTQDNFGCHSLGAGFFCEPCLSLNWSSASRQG